MAIDFDTFTARLQRMPQEVNNELEKSTLSVARGLKSIIQLRIQKTGISSTGAPLPGYSTKEIPAFLYFGKSLNASGEAQVQQAAEEGDGVSYEEFRQFQGLQTGHKDLTFTGSMWKQIDVVPASTGTQFRAVIGPTTPDADNKLTWNGDKYGPILQPSQKEIDQQVKILELKLVDLFESAFE